MQPRPTSVLRSDSYEYDLPWNPSAAAAESEEWGGSRRYDDPRETAIGAPSQPQPQSQSQSQSQPQTQPQRPPVVATYVNHLLNRVEQDYMSCSKVSGLYRQKHQELVELFMGMSKLLMMWQSSEGHAFNRRLKEIMSKFGATSPQLLSERELAMMRAEQRNIMAQFSKINDRLDEHMEIDEKNPFFASMSPAHRKRLVNDKTMRRHAFNEMFLRHGIFNNRVYESLAPQTRELFLVHGTDPEVLQSLDRLNEELKAFTYMPKLIVLGDKAVAASKGGEALYRRVMAHIKQESVSKSTLIDADGRMPLDARGHMIRATNKIPAATPPFNMGDLDFADADDPHVQDASIYVMHDWVPIAASTFHYLLSAPAIRPSILRNLTQRRFTGLAADVTERTSVPVRAVAELVGTDEPFRRFLTAYLASATRFDGDTVEAYAPEKCTAWVTRKLSTHARMRRLTRALRRGGAEEASAVVASSPVTFTVWRAFMAPQPNPWMKTMHTQYMARSLSAKLFVEDLLFQEQREERREGEGEGAPARRPATMGDVPVSALVEACDDPGVAACLRWNCAQPGDNVKALSLGPGERQSTYVVATLNVRTLRKVLFGAVGMHALVSLIEYLLHHQPEVSANGSVGDYAYALIHGIDGDAHEVQLKNAILSELNRHHTLTSLTTSSSTVHPTSSPPTTTLSNSSARSMRNRTNRSSSSSSTQREGRRNATATVKASPTISENVLSFVDPDDEAFSSSSSLPVGPTTVGEEATPVVEHAYSVRASSVQDGGGGSGGGSNDESSRVLSYVGDDAESPLAPAVVEASSQQYRQLSFANEAQQERDVVGAAAAVDAAVAAEDATTVTGSLPSSTAHSNSSRISSSSSSNRSSSSPPTGNNARAHHNGLRAQDHGADHGADHGSAAARMINESKEPIATGLLRLLFQYAKKHCGVDIEKRMVTMGRLAVLNHVMNNVVDDDEAAGAHEYLIVSIGGKRYHVKRHDVDHAPPLHWVMITPVAGGGVATNKK